jgi:hypothetical protein
MFKKIVDNPILVSVVVLLVTLMGILAVLRVPVQLIPDLDIRAVTIVTRWPGATPQDVEREILVEQEEYLRSDHLLRLDGLRPDRDGVPLRHGHRRRAHPDQQRAHPGAVLSRERGRAPDHRELLFR